MGKIDTRPKQVSLSHSVELAW